MLGLPTRCDRTVLSVVTGTVRPTVRSDSVTEPDPLMARIGEGIALRDQGAHVAARDLFAQVWSDIGGERGDPFYRCALAHSMADVQDDVNEELRWDLLALTAADLITLHLNLGECYRKLGEMGLAREHLDRGRASVNALGDDGYGQMIKGGLDRLADRLA